MITAPNFQLGTMGAPAMGSVDGLMGQWLPVNGSQPDYLGMIQALGGFMPQDQQQMPMPGAPAPNIQAGGGQFAAPHQASQFALRPTSQALSGLLGGVMGNGTF